MKHVLKSTLAGLVMAGVMATASAQTGGATGQASMEVNQKIMEAVMKDIPADKMADANFMIEKMIGAMKENLPELKAAAAKDCVAVYGEARKEACDCATEKTDYNDVFEMMKKQAANPNDSALVAELEKMSKKGEEISLSCGFTKEEIAEASKKTAEALQQLEAAPKQ